MKKQLSVIVSIALIFYVCISQHVNAEAAVNTNNLQKEITQLENQMDNQIADSAINYINGKYKTILKMLSEDSAQLNVPADSLKNAILGDPFMIYDLDGDLHYEEVYFPILDENSGDVILTITLYGTTYGWQYKVGTDMVKELNLLEYDPQEPYVFYEEDDEISGQGLSQKVNFSDDTLESDLSKNDFIDSAKEALDNYQAPQKVDIEANQKTDPLIPHGSTASVSELGYNYLILQNACGQGPTSWCWAATVATIANYRLDKKLTAKQVASAMGKNEKQGATLDESQSALRKYGLFFSRRESYAPFDIVKLNIQNHSPMFMGGTCYSEGHAVTIYGYKEVVGEQSLMIWDSASNTNTGNSYMVQYNGAGTVFSSQPGYTVFTWNSTLLNYK